ncbi:MAG TPA: thiamine phosphate synthase [Thermoanaerobaculia bacterium]|nr:thiamine phosphate synthase [Thermoanaerobaculia bacterium]
MDFGPGLILPRIYAITDRTVSGIDSHAEIARRLFSVGIRLLQIREKEMADRDLVAQVDETAALARSNGSLVIVNDRVDVALVAGTGVHLGEEDLPAAEARKILPAGAVVGVSTHDVEAARRALRDPACDYVAYGPVFSSATKTVRGARGLEELARAAEGRSKPLVAIGGITAETLDSVFDAGADSAAMIAGLSAGGAVRIEGKARRALDVARRREIPGRIYLVGFMGSGKTAIGRRIAERLDRPFVDLDAEIERTSGVTIRALFESDGEAAFREREAAFLEGTEALPGAVVATGGGCYVREGNRRAISKLGTAVFLDVPLPALLPRLAGKTDRPLFRDAEQAARLYAEREPFYRMQTVCVRLEGDSVEHAADRVLDALADPGRRRPVL